MRSPPRWNPAVYHMERTSCSTRPTRSTWTTSTLCYRSISLDRTSSFYRSRVRTRDVWRSHSAGECPFCVYHSFYALRIPIVPRFSFNLKMDKLHAVGMLHSGHTPPMTMRPTTGHGPARCLDREADICPHSIPLGALGGFPI